MPIISKEQVENIANLARLDLTKSEVSKMQKELAAILDYINLLNEADVSGVEPTFSPLGSVNVLREDKVVLSDKQVVSDMLSQAPNSEGGYIKTKQILK